MNMFALITPPVQEHVDKHRDTLDKRIVTICRQITVLKNNISYDWGV